MKYSNILKQSWTITWKNKYLWFFGLFAAILGNGGDLDIIVRGFDHENKFFPFGFGWLANTGIFTKDFFTNIILLSATEPLSLFISLFFILLSSLVLIFFIWLVISSQIAIVNNAVKIITNKKHNIKEGLNKGKEYFWQVLILNILLKLFIFVVFFIMLTTLLIKTSALQSFIFILLFVICLILAVIFSFVIKYSICFVVIKGFNVINALKSGWSLFVKNWLISLEMAFLLFLLNFLVLFLLSPLFFVFIVFSKVVLYFGVWFLFISSAMLFLLLITLTGAILSTFQITSWTSLFIELVSRGGVSKLIKIFERKTK